MSDSSVVVSFDLFILSQITVVSVEGQSSPVVFLVVVKKSLVRGR